MRARYVVLEGHDVVAVLSVLPLPSSRYMRERLIGSGATPLSQAVAIANGQIGAQIHLLQSSPETSSGSSSVVAPPATQQADLAIGGWIEDVFGSGDEGSNEDCWI